MFQHPTRILFVLLLLIPTAQNIFSQTNITDSIIHQDFQRKFMVHFPPNFSTETQRALVVSLHGGSGNMINAQGFSMLNPVSDNNNFLVAWPQGYGIAPPGFSWADGRNTSADQAGIDDVGFLNKLIDTLITRYNVDTSKIYICGFSNGGFMVQRMACESSERFAAMASLGASMDTLLYQNCIPSKPIPMAFFNGTEDPAMPYGGGPMQNPQVIPVMPVDSTVQFWVSNNACTIESPPFIFPDIFLTDNSTAELYRFTNCTCNADVHFYKLIGGGHTWPGVFVPSQANVLGNTNRDINASEELWSFFSAHSICSNTTGYDDFYQKKEFSIFPNPVENMLFLKVPQSYINTVSISNTIGNILIEDKNIQSLDVSNLISGVYFISISSDNHTEVIKFIKK